MALRVLHAVESLEAEAGSVSICLRGLIAALRARGIESETVTLNGTPASGAAGARGGLNPAARSKDLRRLVREADVAHVHGWGHHLARAIARAARRARKPFLVSPLGTLGKGPFEERDWRDRLRGRLSERRLIRRASAVTALNEAEERQLRTMRLNSNVVTLPYGVCVSEYENGASAGHRGSGERRARAEDGGSGNGRLVLVLAPMHPVEGFVPFLKALAELGPLADGWNVMIAGPEVGGWRRMLEAAIRRKGASDRVGFAPAPDVAAQQEWLGRASILAAPSLRVRCPASVIQAAAFGVPVLATSCVTPTGMEEVVLVCAPSRGDMKAGLRSLLERSDEQRSAMARRAREVCRAVLDWPVLVERYVQLYRRVAEESGDESETHLG